MGNYSSSALNAIWFYTQPPNDIKGSVKRIDVVDGVDKVFNWEGNLTPQNDIGFLIRTDATTGSLVGNCLIKKITIRGTGTNPFGADNC